MYAYEAEVCFNEINKLTNLKYSRFRSDIHINCCMYITNVVYYCEGYMVVCVCIEGYINI